MPNAPSRRCWSNKLASPNVDKCTVGDEAASGQPVGEGPLSVGLLSYMYPLAAGTYSVEKGMT